VSLLALISTVFPSPIALGYNIYLAGVGGVIGLHRSADIERMRHGLRDGAIDRLLFPTDVIANMSALVSDLGRLFPPRRGQFLIGPTAKLTWNTPPLITADVGLLLEVSSPTRVAIVGVLRAAVPRASEAVLDLKAAFLGTVDLDQGMLAFDASVYDSYLGRGSFKYRFEGDLALRSSWGTRKDFLVSVGGFHPAYRPPAYLKVPALRRVTISLLKDNPRLTLSAYVALTTNTVQFGAELDFHFGVRGFKVVGNFGFDALVQLSPFGFVAAVRARLAVKSGSRSLFSINLEFELSGTTPWRAKGKASFKICWFLKVTVKFDKTWGETRQIAVPQVEVLPKVLAELGRRTNWVGALSSGASSLVQLRDDARSAEAAVLDPAGVLTVRQAVAPLATDLARFGNATPSDVKRIDIQSVAIGSRTLTLDPVNDEFAPASFREMNDRDRLAAASFESRKSGVSARSSTGIEVQYVVPRELAYEQTVSDRTGSAGTARTAVPSVHTVFEALVPGGPAARSPLARRRAQALHRVIDARASDERFSVVVAATLRAADSGSASLTRSEAEAKLRALIQAGQRASELDIVPDYQMAS
jgi:hypothetical protein